MSRGVFLFSWNFILVFLFNGCFDVKNIKKIKKSLLVCCKFIKPFKGYLLIETLGSYACCITYSLTSAWHFKKVKERAASLIFFLYSFDDFCFVQNKNKNKNKYEKFKDVIFFSIANIYSHTLR